MKKLVVLLFTVLISVSTFASVDNPVTETKRELRTKIVQLLGNVDFNVEKEVTAIVSFMINEEGELIIISVKCENCNSTRVDAYLKGKLNYKKVSSNSSLKGKVFKMPFKVVKA